MTEPLAEPLPLKGGQTTRDPRLDRVREFDPRSRNFPSREAVGAVPLRGRGWNVPIGLNQGREGACVGFGWTHDLAATPARVSGLDTAYARAVYLEAQKVDEWPGESYSGTSVLAGAKVVQRLGFIKEYRWAFGIDDTLAALVAAGPVVVGTDWLDGMYDPRPSGLIDVSGSVVGGHCYLLRGLSLKPRLKGERGLGPVVGIWNSWSWHRGFIRVEDMERLLRAGGEACVPIGRRRTPA